MSKLRLEYLDPGSLADNGRNWRTHPKKQLSALRGVIDEVGWAGALLFNERTGRLIDGHARKTVTKNGELVPVLVGDWTEEDEAKILATLDPLAAMAQTNDDALKALLKGIETENEELKGLMEKIAQDEGITPPDFKPSGIDEQSSLDEKAKVTCPECGHEF